MNHVPVSPTRRQLLFSMAGAALAHAQPRNRIYNPLLATSTSMWQTEAAFRRVPLGSIIEEAFTSIRRAGFGRIELASEFLAPELMDHTAGLLRKTKLQPAIVSVSGSLYERAAAEDSRERVLEIARLMTGWDARFIDYHPAAKPNNAAKTPDELETEAYQLNRMGQDLSQVGMSLMAGSDRAALQDDAREWRYTVSHTESGLVSFCLDVDLAVRAGIRPVSLLDSAGPRLRSIQLRNPRNGVNQELLREGDIDMVPIARFLRDSAYDGYLVVDLQPDPQSARQHTLTEDLSLSRWYMQEIFGSRPGGPPVDMGPHVRERKLG